MHMPQPTIALITIGDELLSGLQINTNATNVCRQLFLNNYLVVCQLSLPDQDEVLKQTLQQVFQQYDVVLITGGLGPTHDDRTRQVVAEILGKKLIKCKQTAQQLQQRFANKVISIENQSLVVDEAMVLENSSGTAPGQLIQDKSTTIFLLPGVPAELNHLTNKHVLPWMKRNHALQSEIHSRYLCFFNLSEGLIAPEVEAMAHQHPIVGIGIYPDLGIIKMHLKSTDSDQLTLVTKYLLRKYRQHFYAEGDIDFAQIVAELIMRQPLITVIEQFTGGLLSEQLTKHCVDTKNIIDAYVTVAPLTQTEIMTKFSGRNHLLHIGKKQDQHVSIELYKAQDIIMSETVKVPQQIEFGRRRVLHRALAMLFQQFNSEN